MTLLAEHVVETLVPDVVGEAIVMKGVEIAQLYPHRHWRPFRDVDLLTEHTEHAWHACIELGFQHRSTDRLDPAHHHLPPLKAPFGSVGLDLMRELVLN